MNAERFSLFSEQYRAQLALIAQEKPEYFMKGRSVNTIADNMLNAIYSHGIRSVSVTNSEGFKRTCKALSIPHTYKGIEEYLTGEVQ